MLNHLRALAVFSKVAELGSFRAASKQLGISASVVSHHVTVLEAHLDTPLIYRTTRKLSLTAAGEQLAGSARKMLMAAEEGFGAIYRQSPELKGSLKITAPAILQYARFVTRIATILKQHPKVEISISFSDKRSNLVEEGYDLGFRVGLLEDSSMIARKLADGRLMLCASADYLAAHDIVKRPKDLEKMQLIDLAGVRTEIVLTPKADNPVTNRHGQLVRVPHRISLDSGFAVRRMAEEGLGVMMLPDFFVHEAIDAGRLVEVLPDWQAPSIGIYAIWPPNAGRNHVRNALLKYVAAIANTEPEMDALPVE